MSQERPSRSKRLEIEQQLREHAAYEKYLECTALHRTISTVFVPNWRELLALLHQASTDPKLAIELMQNVRRPDIREEFYALTTQRLHNYVAGTATLVDHVRRVRDARDDAITEEFDRRLAQVNSHGEPWFVKDLRNFTTHRSLPFLGHRVTFTGNTTEGMQCEIELDVAELLTWKKWSAPSKAYLAAQSEVIALRSLIQAHGQLLLRLNIWFHDELASANEQGLEELNRLVVARNAALLGGDEEAGRRMTDMWTKMRSNSEPPESLP